MTWRAGWLYYCMNTYWRTDTYRQVKPCWYTASFPAYKERPGNEALHTYTQCIAFMKIIIQEQL